MSGSLPSTEIRIHAGAALGPLEAWRHSLGHGGINPEPLPDRVVEGARRLEPRLIRVFLQEFFRTVSGGRALRLEPPRPVHGRARPDGGARDGGDHDQAAEPLSRDRPLRLETLRRRRVAQGDLPAREALLGRPADRHPLGGRERDGHRGRRRQPVPDPRSRRLLPLLPHDHRAGPGGVSRRAVGGPAACWVENEPLPGFVRRCREERAPLHFISWHLYSDDPARHAAGVEKAKELMADWPGPRPETMVTEWSKSFDRVSVEAWPSSRAARR